jgi:hypothetical protein
LVLVSLESVLMLAPRSSAHRSSLAQRYPLALVSAPAWAPNSVLTLAPPWALPSAPPAKLSALVWAEKSVLTLAPPLALPSAPPSKLSVLVWAVKWEQ